ncbi:MAG: hypothetical protein ACTSXT_13335 [Candidatus Helarchaeota archaeon]
MKIKLTQIYRMNENLIFPTCTNCGKETSPFMITSTEINKLEYTQARKLMNNGLLIVNKCGENKHLIILCKKCQEKYIEVKK